ncbi:MAG: hypothetical protein AUH12_06950 [Gemmatimonadetes bacterium 13_2_20CM_69_8]|nr:MAG: hypothetical protein AUH12_06950 [Gemmatimonadetes bacterium 13_2_20CM_69_8]
MRPVYGIVVRELVRFVRQRGRVLASLARPFVWLIFAGAGFATVFTGGGEIALHGHGPRCRRAAHGAGGAHPPQYGRAR